MVSCFEYVETTITTGTPGGRNRWLSNGDEVADGIGRTDFASCRGAHIAFTFRTQRLDFLNWRMASALLRPLATELPLRFAPVASVYS